MGTRYLTDLAQVVRNAGLSVTEDSGWQTRARSSGGYEPNYPNGIVIHHTASNATPQQDVDYICRNADVAPISNLYLDRSGMVWICAGGAANHAGSGGPTNWWPQDGANSRSIGIEAANNGIGEQWPTVQQQAYVKLCYALCNHYAIPVGQIVAHFEWAPTRKIDPAGNSKYANGGNSWNMDAFRGDVVLSGQPVPPTPPSSTDEAFKNLVRTVMNEGAATGSGADPQFPGKPWAESSNNAFDLTNEAHNRLISIERKLDEVLQRLQL